MIARAWGGDSQGHKVLHKQDKWVGDPWYYSVCVVLLSICYEGRSHVKCSYHHAD